MSEHTHVHTAPEHSELGQFLRVSFVALALIMVAFGHQKDHVQVFAVVFVSIVLEAFPFMLLGSLLSGLIEEFVSKDRLASLLPRRRLVTTTLAACAGLVFPVCECAIVPVVRRFLRKGVPLSAAIAYLLAGPVVNPIVGASTAVAYSGAADTMWAAVGIRLGGGFLVALVVGLIVGRLDRRALLEEPAAVEHHHHHGGGRGGRLAAAVRHGADEFLDIGQYLILGAFVAAIAQTWIPRADFVALAGAPVVAVVLMMILAILLNLCSEADAFVAASFRTSLPMSGQMAFMILGPMLDLKLLAMYLGVFRKRFIVVLAGLVFLAVLLLVVTLQGFGMDEWFQARGIGPGGVR
jgi:uncharacterized membrane protein YraQ (UPF0718 family)